MECPRNFLPQTHLVHSCLASEDVGPLIAIAIGQLMKNCVFFFILNFVSVVIYSSKNRRKFRVSATYLVQQFIPFSFLLPYWFLQPSDTELIGSRWIFHCTHLLVHWIPTIFNFGHPCPCMYFGRNLLLFGKVNGWKSLKDLPFIEFGCFFESWFSCVRSIISRLQCFLVSIFLLLPSFLLKTFNLF